MHRNKWYRPMSILSILICFFYQSIMFSGLFPVMIAFAAEPNCHVLDPDIATEYKGGCKDGKASGKGIAKGRDIYEGNFIDGKPNGKGVYTWYNGDVYDGNWKDGQREGWGVLKRPNGAYYEGEWKNGKRHGNGKYKWQNGAYYEGEWRDDDRDGIGIYYGADNSYYKGEWSKGLQHGRGVYKWPDGTYIKGNWRNGQWVKEEKRKITVTLDQHIFDVLEAESQKTGESISAVISRSVNCLEARDPKGMTKK